MLPAMLTSRPNRATCCYNRKVGESDLECGYAMPRWLLIIGAVVVLVGVLAIGAAQLQGQAAPSYQANVIGALSDNGNNGDIAGFARAVTVRNFQFPQDYGAHPDFQTEWWYYTGNLVGTDGRRFGFEFT